MAGMTPKIGKYFGTTLKSDAQAATFLKALPLARQKLNAG
jgi:hypothetical protein